MKIGEKVYVLHAFQKKSKQGIKVITIQEFSEPPVAGDAWDVLEAMTGTIEAPPDWSSEHDHYLYGSNFAFHKN